MTVPIDRELLVQAFIVLSLCAGGWMFFVEPGASELRALDAISEQQRHIAASIDYSSLRVSADMASAMRERTRVIFDAGQFSANSAALYDRITAQAEAHEVQVKNLRPGIERKSGEKGRTFVVTRLDMTVEGDYERIARFLESMDEIGGYLRPVSVQIAPSKAEGGSFAIMQLGFEAIRFDLPESLMALVETDS
jgi:hypothetical protein